jgi:DNA-binding Lrp family transcriptional regulator
VSIKVMTLVWDGFDASGSELLCMLALADWCDDFGGNLYPSMATIAEKIRLSEKQARRIIHKFEQDGWLEVIGCANGGAPGSSKRWKLNVKRIAELAAKETVKTEQTPPASVSPPIDVTPPTGVPDPSHGCPSTPPMGVPEGSHPWEPIRHEPSLEPPVNPSGQLALAEAATPETVFKQVCRDTWMAYEAAYKKRWNVVPVRNAAVNSKVVQLVKRLGDEAPAVAEFFVTAVGDAFVVRKCHAIGDLLQGAEAYRTQWANGQAMTGTKARQMDQTQSNFDAAGDAIALLRAKRGAA